jgi:uncharacterized Zn-finger protein
MTKSSKFWALAENRKFWFDVSHLVDHHFPSFSLLPVKYVKSPPNFPSISVSNKFPDIGWESGGLCHPTLCAG